MQRRDFLKTMAAFGLASMTMGTRALSGSGRQPGKKVLILAIDGMDPRLAVHYMGKGLMPNFQKLARTGAMSALATSTPPQSPVAWSNFIAGAPPQHHGIYDFIHRDPRSLAPYLSTSAVRAPDNRLRFGQWDIPLSSGRVENLRRGRPFWDLLTERDIPVTLFKMPANFPCESSRARMVSEMGTPDLRGGYGNYTLFTTAPGEFAGNLSGGILVPVEFEEGFCRTNLSGPVNSLKKDRLNTTIPLKIWRDPVFDTVRILIQQSEFVLKRGEWSGWVPISFPLMDPIVKARGIVKLFVKNVHPQFHLYVSPINIDPAEPVLPVVSAKDYGRELVRNVGYFYTQGFPEDTKALSEGILTEEEYIELAGQILTERKSLLDYEFKRFSRQDSGLFFFYISSLDQNSHMYFRTIDPVHPLYDPELRRKYGHILSNLYGEMDLVLGKLLSGFDVRDPANTLIVMSDHGFVSFRRQVNLNNWLLENDFLSLIPGREVENRDYLANVEWSKTAAYNVGINAIYLNRAGRETDGALSPGEADAARRAIRRGLLALVDPGSGKRAVHEVRVTPEQERALNPHAPDLIVGWGGGYRTSWTSILGGFSTGIFEDNLDKWSGDHCVAAPLVPATVLANRPIVKNNPALCDVTATILSQFGVPREDRMTGVTLFS